jgi:hypothetical protein
MHSLVMEKDRKIIRMQSVPLGRESEETYGARGMDGGWWMCWIEWVLMMIMKVFEKMVKILKAVWSCASSDDSIA